MEKMNYKKKRKISNFIIILIISITLLTLIPIYGCNESGDQDSTPDNNLPEQDNSDLGYFFKNIDSLGGTVEVNDKKSSLHGAKIIITPNAINREQIISISANPEKYPLPPNYIPAGEEINFGPDGTLFNKSVEISAPYLDANSDGIIDGTDQSEYDVKLIYYNEDEKKWEDIPILNRDVVANVVEAETYHFSTYLVALEDQAPIEYEDVEFRVGEYFVGDMLFTIIDPKKDYNDPANRKMIPRGCIGQANNRCGSSYVLTITMEDGLKAVIDKYTTLNGGIPVDVNEDGNSVSFDPLKIFEKVRISQSAKAWDWRCQFVPEHTVLPTFRVCGEEDTRDLCNVVEDERYNAEIEAVSDNEVKISYGINLNIDSGNFGPGYRMAIEFEANYIGEAEEVIE